MAKHYSTKDVANELVVSEQTIRLWAKTFEVPYSKSSGNIRFSDDAVRIFERIKNLRDDNSGFETIRRKITPDTQWLRSEMGEEPAEAPVQTQTAEDEPRVPARPQDLESLEGVITRSIQQSISEHTELAERYARATYRIGELETTVRFLQEKMTIPAKDEPEVKSLPTRENQGKLQDWLKKLFKP